MFAHRLRLQALFPRSDLRVVLRAVPDLPERQGTGREPGALLRPGLPLPAGGHLPTQAEGQGDLRH